MQAALEEARRTGHAQLHALLAEASAAGAHDSDGSGNHNAVVARKIRQASRRTIKLHALCCRSIFSNSFVGNVSSAVIINDAPSDGSTAAPPVLVLFNVIAGAPTTEPHHVISPAAAAESADVASLGPTSPNQRQGRSPRFVEPAAVRREGSLGGFAGSFGRAGAEGSFVGGLPGAAVRPAAGGAVGTRPGGNATRRLAVPILPIHELLAAGRLASTLFDAALEHQSLRADNNDRPTARTPRPPPRCP
jgi:hypothetical protein